jgi:hypothetical protein
MGENSKIIAEFSPRGQELMATSHQLGDVRRCSGCQIRKVLNVAFYRDRKSRGGYRRECKKCRNRARAQWPRDSYVPKIGRRNRMKANRARV